MNTNIIAAEILTGGQSTEFALSTTSAQGPVLTLPNNFPAGVPAPCTLTVDVAFYVRKGSNPVAVAAVDQRFPAGMYRIELLPGERLALVLATGTGSASFTPGA